MVTPRSVVVLSSGGMDSAVLLARAHAWGILARGLFVRYGQPAEAEEEAAVRAQWARLPCRGEIAALTLWGMGELRAAPGEAGARIVPGRNLALISVAANLAESIGADAVWLGATAEDHGYPDCSAAFVETANATTPIAVAAPLMGLSRAAVRAEAEGRGLIGHTWSCYAPQGSHPCGTCNSCRQDLPVAP